ncbi:MAG: hypothetical protein IKW39_01265 [Alphaproteobacteria bacterium]|nr:hypothetical protein [Alphaproteobacteria bacterium]
MKREVKHTLIGLVTIFFAMCYLAVAFQTTGNERFWSAIVSGVSFVAYFVNDYLEKKYLKSLNKKEDKKV